MAIKGFARLRVPAAVAKPSPAIGQALGPLGVNMMEFCRQFNARTTIFKEEVPLRVKVIAKEDRTFDFNISAPPTTWFLKQASGITKGAQQPGIEKAGEVSIRALYVGRHCCQHLCLPALTLVVAAAVVVAAAAVVVAAAAAVVDVVVVCVWLSLCVRVCLAGWLAVCAGLALSVCVRVFVPVVAHVWLRVWSLIRRFEIAQIKKEHDENLSTMDLQGIVKSLMGSAKSMGLEVTK